MGLEPGQVLDGKYKIVRIIGEGGMGAVFEGANTFINRRVAIKVLHANAAANDAIIKRFEREAQAAGTIGSDHILEVLDLGTLPGGDRYMVMEFLDGEELSARIERLGTLTPRQLAPLIRQTLLGLRAAHAAQIIHRDLKPDNIFVLREKAGQKDFVKIIDFGISKFSALAGDMSMTTTGSVMGTPFYMSPEQAKGSASVDARTDLYAVGVIMYEALTGRVPFEGTSFNDLMFKIVLSDAPALPETIQGDFRALVQKAMARDSAQRYQTAEEFIAAIDQWLVAEGLRESGAGGVAGFDQTSPAGLAGGSRRATLTPAAAMTQQGLAPNATTQAGLVPNAMTQAGLAPNTGAAQTDGNWEASREDTPSVVPTNKSPVPLIAAGVAALLVAAGAAFALLGGSGEGEKAATAVAEPPAESPPVKAVEPPVKTEPAQPAKVEPPKPAESSKVQPVVEPAKAEPAKTEPATTKPAATTAATTKPATTATTKPATTTKSTTTTTKPATTTKSPTTTKPTTTTTKPKGGVDLGY